MRRAGVAEHTRIVGHVGNDDLAALYQLSECLLLTSAYEGFGLPPLEAMASGTPVAVFDNSSLREVVGDAALVAPDGDSVAMAGTVAALLADQGEQQRRSLMGRQRAPAFTWERTATATLDVYQGVLGAR